MNNWYYTYNNEALACCVFWKALELKGSIDIAKLCLILPFVFDVRVTNYLKSQESDKLEGIIPLICNKPTWFTAYNKRYLALLPVAINTLVILQQARVIYANKNLIMLNEDSLIRLDEIQQDITGNRLSKIYNVVPRLLYLLENCRTNELYNLLNIRL